MAEQISMSAVFEFMSQSAVTTVTTVCLLHTDMAAHVGSYIPDMFFHMSICLSSAFCIITWCSDFVVDDHLSWMPGGSDHLDRAFEQKKQASQSGGRFHSKHSLCERRQRLMAQKPGVSCPFLAF